MTMAIPPPPTTTTTRIAAPKITTTTTTTPEQQQQQQLPLKFYLPNFSAGPNPKYLAYLSSPTQ